MAIKIQAKEQGRPFQPRQHVADGLLPAEWANDPFNLVHYPFGWAWHDRHGFLPELCEIVHKPGVNGVEVIGKGKAAHIDTKRAYGGSYAKGGTVIKPTDARLGPWQGFLCVLDCVGGGLHHCFRETEFTSLGGGRLQQEDTSESWFEFRAYLRDKKLVPAISAPEYRRLLSLAQDKLRRLRKRKAEREEIDEQRERIKAMEAAWAALQPAPEDEGLAEGEAPKALAKGRVKLAKKTANVEIPA